MTRIDVRRVADDEVPVWAEIHNAVVARKAVTPEERRHERRMAPNGTDLIAWTGAAAAGVAELDPYGDHGSESDAAFVEVSVLPGHRRAGIGSALLAGVTAAARALELRWMDAVVAEDDPAGRAFAERNGFREVERLRDIALRLADVVPEPVAPPPGISVTTYAARPDLARGVWEVAAEALPDVPGEEPIQAGDFEGFVAEDMDAPGLVAEAFFIALHGEQVVAYASLRQSAARPGVGYHYMTGVRRSHRRRGIASALKRAQIAWAKSAGLAALETTNEERNTPIRRIGARYGYRPLPDRLVVRGPVAR